MNEYDSSKMADLLGVHGGYVLTEDEESADLLLLNTCSIREKAQEKVFHQLGRWKKLKETNPALKIGVGGCVASQEGEAIKTRAPFVDLVFGPQTLHRLPSMLKTSEEEGSSVIDISFPRSRSLITYRLRKLRVQQHSFRRWRAAVNIARFASCPIREAKRFPDR